VPVSYQTGKIEADDRTGGSIPFPFADLIRPSTVLKKKMLHRLESVFQTERMLILPSCLMPMIVPLFRYVLFLLILSPHVMAAGNPAVVSGKADSLEALLKLENNQEKKLRILVSLSEELGNTIPDKGIIYAKEALQIAEMLKDQDRIITTTILLANLYRKNGDLKQAAACGQRAMDLARRLNLDNQFIATALVQGYIYDALGDYHRSMEIFFTCLKISEKLADRKQISRALYGIGFTCFSQNNYPRALDYYQKALSISRELKDTTGIAGCLNNISAVYGSQNDTQYIERYVREAVAINLRMNNLHWVSINYGNLGSYFLARKQFDSAFVYLGKAYEIAVSIQNASQMAASSYGISRFYLLTLEPDSGLRWAIHALNLGRRYGLKKTVYEAAFLLREIYIQKKEPLMAYQFDTLRYLMKDSLDLDVNNTLLSKLELQYQLEKSVQEKKLEEQRRLAITIIIIVSLLAMIIIMVLLYIRHRLKTKYLGLEKEKLETELDFRNKELASNVMSLMKKNEILTELTQRLIAVQQQAAKEETRSAIQQIAGDLQKSMETGIWEEFELRFRQVHTDFYDKLLQKYPDLSPNEQKLCAFLRLNLTNKEIAELTGQSIKALETARYRLRIKFGISNSNVNLITFLSSI
jgi:tetratricopeptide (TPR) repeat protein